MQLWFTSDSHFSHALIIEYSKRPFSSVQEMDEAMIAGWNERVKTSDHIYHLGDLTMMRPKYIKHIIDRLNGHKRLVRGNHDIFKTHEYIEAGFKEIYGVRVIDNLLFTHIPVHPMSKGHFDFNVYGHLHNNLIPDPFYINVCVEHTNYHPISLEELRQIGKRQKSLSETMVEKSSRKI
jgi:calcineurin-like phosphoesterase family protein